MSAIRIELVYAAINRSYALMDYKIHDNFHKQHEFKQQTILADESLTKDEKTYALRMINKTYDTNKVFFNEGTRRICEIGRASCRKRVKKWVVTVEIKRK